MEVMTTLERQIQRNRRLLEGDPSNVDLMLAYAYDCLRRDLRFEALVNFQKALAVREFSEARVALVQIFTLQAVYGEAYEELRQLFKSDPINIMGHVWLQLLQKLEPTPEDLKPRLMFVPARSDLSEALIRCQNERDLLRRELQEYEQVIVSTEGEPEPILIYCEREARQRVERINRVLGVLNSWEPLAVDIPGFRGEEMAPAEAQSLLQPQVEESAPALEGVEAVAEEVVSEPQAQVLEEVAAVEEPSPALSEVLEEPLPEPTVEAEELEAQPAVDSTSAVELESEVKEEPIQPVEPAEGPAVEEREELPSEEVEVSASQVEEVRAEPTPEDLEREAKFIEPLSTLCKVKGDVRAVIVTEDGRLAAGEGQLSNRQALADNLLLCLATVQRWQTVLHNWVCEGKSSSLVIMRLSDKYYLVVEGRSVTLGILRQRIERCKSELSTLC